MIAMTGCGCAPAVVVRWVVVTALVLGGVALIAVGRRRSRRAAASAAGSTSPAGGSSGPDGPSPRARRARPELTGGLLLALAVVVAAASLGSDLSLLSLVVGAAIASVGMGATPPRRRTDPAPAGPGRDAAR